MVPPGSGELCGSIVASSPQAESKVIAATAIRMSRRGRNEISSYSRLVWEILCDSTSRSAIAFGYRTG
jgi:hypothetical protein